MDFVAFNFLSAGQMGRGDTDQGLVGEQGCFDVEEAQPVNTSGFALEALGIVDFAAEHLVAAAKAKHAAAPSDMGLEVNVPTLCPQSGEVSHGGFGAGNDDQARIAGNRLVSPQEADRNTGFQAQGIEIIEIGNAGQSQNANFVVL